MGTDDAAKKELILLPSKQSRKYNVKKKRIVYKNEPNIQPWLKPDAINPVEAFESLPLYEATNSPILLDSVNSIPDWEKPQ